MSSPTDSGTASAASTASEDSAFRNRSINSEPEPSPSIEVGGHQHGSLRSGRGKLGGVNLGVSQPGFQCSDAEIHYAVLCDVRQRLPGLSDAVAIDRIIGLLPQILDYGQNRTLSGNPPSGTIETAEALAKRIKRDCLGHEPIQVEIDPDLQTLCGNDQQGCGRLRTAGYVGSERLQPPDDPIPVNVAGSPDHQYSVEFTIVLQHLKDLACQIDPVDNDADSGCGNARLTQPCVHCARMMRKVLGRCVLDDKQSGGFGGLESLFQDGVSTVSRCEHERPLGRHARGRGEQHRLYTRPAELPHGGQCLPEGLGQMRLVEKDQTVLPEEAGVYGLHAVRYTIAANMTTGEVAKHSVRQSWCVILLEV